MPFTILEGLARFIIGGTLVLAVSLVGRYGKSSLAGVIVLFPAVSFLSFYFLGRVSDIETVKNTVFSSLFALPLVAVFLLSVLIFLKNNISVNCSLILGIAIWIFCAIIYLKFLH